MQLLADQFLEFGSERFGVSRPSSPDGTSKRFSVGVPARDRDRLARHKGATGALLSRSGIRVAQVRLVSFEPELNLATLEVVALEQGMAPELAGGAVLQPGLKAGAHSRA